ncbi:MAG: cyclic nucleotide-binding protein [Segetibacter sp.]|nr:cyclic nucleotide-binding protein [Segetibacter sp.]
MYEVFFKKLAEKITLTTEEVDLFKTYLTPKKLRRKQYLLQEGDVCKYSAFVEKGALRSYTIDEKGNEYIIQFALEGWFIGDMYSMLTGEPATQNIDAIEDSELVLISKQAEEEIMKRIPKYEHFMRLLLQNAYIAAQRRFNHMASLSTEERYTKLLNTYPEIVQRVPQHMIASYLGLTPETLSRARKQMSRK